MTMIRKQVFITEEQSQDLKSRSRAAGVSEAQLIRSGIDRELAATENAEAWKQRIMRAAGSLSDVSHLERVIKKNRSSWRKRAEQTRKKLSSAE